MISHGLKKLKKGGFMAEKGGFMAEKGGFVAEKGGFVAVTSLKKPLSLLVLSPLKNHDTL